MNKRLLALLLVLCMVLISVPVFALPAAAAEEIVYEYETSFNSTTNLPTINGDVVTVHGNWQPMAYITGLNNQAYPLARASHPSFASTTTITFNDWPGATYIPGWAQKGGMMIANPNNAQTGYFNTPGQLNVTDECSMGIRYTAEKTGVIDIIFDKLGNYNAGGDPNGAPLGLENFRYGIFVNGTMVWPVQGGTLAATDALTENKTDYVAITDLSIEAGDQIDFICAAAKECAQWPGAANVMFPTIGYSVVTSTSFAQNIPTVSGSGVATSGNWAPMGYLKANGYADTSKAYPMDQSDYNATVGAHKFAAPSAWPGGDVKGWAQKPFMLLKLDNAGNGWFNTIGALSVAQPFSGGVRYTVDKTGAIDIVFDLLGNTGTGSTCVGLSNYRYGIFLNGEMVWPVEGGTLSETDALTANLTDYTALTNLAVKEGDIIDFICEVQVATDNWTGAGNVIFPTINYTALSLYSTSYNSNTNMPTLNGTATVVNGNWAPMTYTKTNGTTNLNNAYPMDLHSTVLINNATVITPSAWPGGAVAGWAQKSTLILDTKGAQPTYWVSNGQFNVTSAMSVGMRYTVEKTGVADIIFDQLGNYASSSKGISDFRYGIFVNGTMVWPVAGGNLTTDGVLAANKTDYLAVDDIELKKGDIVEFVCEAQTANGSWEGAGNIMFPTISYSQLAPEFVYSSSFDISKLPSADAVYPDAAWGIYNHDRVDGVASFGANGNGKLLNTQSALFTAANGQIGLSHNPSAYGWAYRAHVILASFNANYFNEIGQIAVGKDCVGSIRYTAEKNGMVEINIDRLANTAKSNATFTYSVMVNGESLWSTQITTTGAAYGNVITNTTPDSLKNIALSKGDLVEFVIESTGANGIWDGSGSVFFGTVNYTEVYAAPTATANVTVGTALSSAATVVLPDGVTATESGLFINGVKTAGASAAILEGIAIKDIESTKVTVQPYYVAENGLVVKGDAITVSIASLLAKYEGNATAAAVLNYAAAAQAYFDIDGTLSYTDTTVGDYSDKTATVTNTLAGATANPTEIALILNATTSAQIKVLVPNAPVGAQLKVVANGNTDFVDLTDGAFFIDGIGVENWNEQFELTVVDSEGNAISSTFTYGVSTYYNRMINKSDDAALKNLITAMMALYETL